MQRIEKFLLILHAVGVMCMLFFGTVLLGRSNQQAEEIRATRETVRLSAVRRDSILVEIRAHQDSSAVR